MKDTLITLAELSFSLGLIGIDEFLERIKIACWLSENSGKINDPRMSENEEGDGKDNEEIGEIEVKIACF